MKNNIKYYLIVVLSLLLVSCGKDFLEIQPKQNLSTDNAITDVNSMQAAVNGVYSLLQSSDYYGRSMILIPDLMADNLFISAKNSGRYLDFDAFIVQERDGYVEDAWNVMYAVIINASKAIQAAERIVDSGDPQPDKMSQLIGEAYALRALAHFDLVRLFAQPYNYTADASHPGIPIVSTISDDPILPARNSVKEVYNAIISDLEDSIILMNEDKNDGYFSIPSAEALLCRVNLYKEDWDETIIHANNVISSINYSLVLNPDYVDSWDVDFNSESLFEVVNTETDNAESNSIGHTFDVAGYADALVTDDLLNEYELNDVRRDLIRIGVKPNAEDPANFVEKYPDGALHTDNIKVLRLSEVYLNRAEAYANSEEPILALADLNQIVERADPSAAVSGISGQDLIDRIILERRKELAFEGHRLFDLNRNKKGVNIINSEDIIVASYPNDRFILPIPLSEIDANPNINENNPGY